MADIIDLAIERLEAERAARIQAKIDAGKAVRRPPIVVGVPDPKRDYDAVYRDDQGREVYPPEDCTVIITGVPRTGRDDSEHVAAHLASARTKEPDVTIGAAAPEPDDRYARVRMKPLEKLPPPLPQPMLDPLPSSPQYPVRCTVRPPNPDKGDPGQIIEASYTITGNLLRVYDEEDRLLGSEAVKAGDDVDAAARKLLREKHGKHTAFYDPIPYRVVSV